MNRRDFLRFVGSIPALAALSKLPIIEAPPPKQVIEGHNGSMFINDGHGEVKIEVPEITEELAEKLEILVQATDKASAGLQAVAEAVGALAPIPTFSVPEGSRVLITQADIYSDIRSYDGSHIFLEHEHGRAEVAVTITKNPWDSYAQLQKIDWGRCLLVLPHPRLSDLYLEAWPTSYSIGDDGLTVYFAAKNIVLT